ncbi:MAG: hypothetical protein ABSA53_24425 [Streptosporangiaceae bacterium]|jgi:hypothetical protein
MDSATDAPGLEAIVRFWGHAYTFSHDTGTCPGNPYAARRRDGQGTIRAATPALLLDAIKDDAAARPLTTGDAA